MVQHPGGHAQQAHAHAGSQDQEAYDTRRYVPALLHGGKPTGDGPGACMDRHPRGRSRTIQVLPQHTSGACLRIRKGNRYTCTHILQERERKPHRQPQVEQRSGTGLLLQAGRCHQHHHRDRCRPVGMRP